jgi:flagellar motor component MotA
LAILALLLAIWVSNYVDGGTLFWDFVESSSFAVVVIGLAGCALSGMAPSRFLAVIRLATGSPKETASPAALRAAKGDLDFIAKTSLILGGLGFLLGAINMIKDIDLKTRVGPSVALAFYSVLYAAIILLAIYVPLQAALRQRIARLE